MRLINFNHKLNILNNLEVKIFLFVLFKNKFNFTFYKKN